jgi:hypothetical protein
MFQTMKGKVMSASYTNEMDRTKYALYRYYINHWHSYTLSNAKVGCNHPHSGIRARRISKGGEPMNECALVQYALVPE